MRKRNEQDIRLPKYFDALTCLSVVYSTRQRDTVTQR